ncbi:MAG: hypothetical protein JXR95_13140 [Deltaproteobacteria bacterium]|nr:hypothetical protein [Deltaproteobacteria bacterium]
MNKKTVLLMVFAFAATTLLSGCIIRSRGSRRCYKNSRGKTVCKVKHHKHRRHH